MANERDSDEEEEDDDDDDDEEDSAVPKLEEHESIDNYSGTGMELEYAPSLEALPQTNELELTTDISNEQVTM